MAKAALEVTKDPRFAVFTGKEFSEKVKDFFRNILEAPKRLPREIERGVTEREKRVPQ